MLLPPLVALALPLARPNAPDGGAWGRANANATTVTSRLGWEHRARAPPAEDAWALRCDAPRAHAVLATGGATVVATVPAGARCRLRTATAWRGGGGGARGPALAGACWVGFGRRLCAPRGFVEHFEFRVPPLLAPGFH